MELKFKVEHDHTDGPTMTMTWQNGIQLTTEFGENGRCWIARGNKVEQMRELAGVTIAEFIKLQEQCQEWDEQLGQFKQEQ